MPNPEKSRGPETPDVKRSPDVNPSDVAQGAQDSQDQAQLYVVKVKQAYKALAAQVLGRLKLTTEQQHSVISQFDSWSGSKAMTLMPGFQNHLQGLANAPKSRTGATGVLDPRTKLKLGFKPSKQLTLKLDIRPTSDPSKRFKYGATYSLFDGKGKLGLKLAPSDSGVTFEPTVSTKIKSGSASHVLTAKLKLKKGYKAPKEAEVSYLFRTKSGLALGAFAIVNPGDKAAGRKPAFKIFLNLGGRF